eukprot:COSAG03_NODE_14970_length_445_cov_1.147399_1_plen_86_part_01
MMRPDYSLRSGAHVEECFQLTFGEQAAARNVSDGVFGDTLGIQNDVTRELAYLGRDAGPYLVRNEYGEMSPTTLLGRCCLGSALPC